MQEEKLFRKDFVFIIIINFLVFLNHLAILATFPFYIEALGGSEVTIDVISPFFRTPQAFSQRKWTTRFAGNI